VSLSTSLSATSRRRVINDVRDAVMCSSACAMQRNMYVARCCTHDDCRRHDDDDHDGDECDIDANCIDDIILSVAVTERRRHKLVMTVNHRA
jgi:hypothetical protein